MDKADNADKSYPWLKSYPNGIVWDTPIVPGTVHDLIDQAAERYPHNTCIHFLGKKYTYSNIKLLSDRVATGLQQWGVGPGTKVGLFMPNTPFFVIFYYGVLKTGATVVNFNPLYAEHEIIHQINDSETSIMVTLNLQALYPKLRGVMAQTSLHKIIVCPLQRALPFPKNLAFTLLKQKDIASVDNDDHIIQYDDLIDNDGQYQHVDISPTDSLAVLQYTGGTTGTPKGSMLSHANLYANVMQCMHWFTTAQPGQEKFLAALPFFHVFAMSIIMNVAVKFGSQIVIMFPRFNVLDAMKMIQKHKITIFPAVPTIYNMINNHPDGRRYDLRSVKLCVSGGAALPTEVQRRFEELTDCHLVEGYGLSETSPVIAVNPIDGQQKAGSIGLPFVATTIKILSTENKTQEMPLGEIGEICVKGPQVMRGYWQRPADTEQAFTNGYFRTGDVGDMDDEGYIFLVDRIKDLIICNGFNIYPRHIEEALYLHPAIEECVVIGIKDDQKGEIPKAFIKLKTEHTVSVDELREFLKDKLAPIEIPKTMEFRDSLPKTMIGKLSKKELVAEEQQQARA